jgi:transcriptional regulator with XRE-family HTH domain
MWFLAIIFRIAKGIEHVPKESRIKTQDGLYNQIGLRVSERRIALGISKSELARRIAKSSRDRWIVSRLVVYEIETGVRIVSDLEIIELAIALDCDPTWLFLGSRTEAVTTIKEETVKFPES